MYIVNIQYFMIYHFSIKGKEFLLTIPLLS